ncbi:M16 family metallopeptidase [Sciscionella marina]|uniref:M16 family metallopeptidase n=1 Tax=Sciscionella marina TaxID=508770 RepID=UPI000369F37E|nr:pitrilysin family protein [Sciscionella marina]
MSRTAAEIASTERGPRELPPLGVQPPAAGLEHVDTVLPNGLRVLAVASRGVPLVELRLRIPFAKRGAGTGDPAYAARAEVLAGTILTGTSHRDRIAMDTDLALVGGELDAVVDPEKLLIEGSCLAGGLDKLLEVLADALTSASYVPSEVDNERARLVERLSVAWSQPSIIARAALQRHRYADHPYALEVPQASDVTTVTGEEVRAMHAESVLPRGSSLVLVGDFDPAEVTGRLADALGGWTGEQTAQEMPPLPELTGGDIALVHREGAVQSQIRLSAQGIARTDERYAALQLANMIYGGYFSSRLVENIREDKGYTYGASSRLEFTPAGCSVLVGADTASEVTAAALLETRYELARLAIVEPSEAETESVRQYAIGSLLTARSAQAGLASQLAALVAVGLGVEWLSGHQARLEAVTREQIAETAAEFFAPARFTGVVVGDAALLSAKLRVLGGVVIP